MSKLELHNVVKRFGDNTVCDGINLNVDQGQMVCLIGASGAGKSTFRFIPSQTVLSPKRFTTLFSSNLDIIVSHAFVLPSNSQHSVLQVS